MKKISLLLGLALLISFSGIAQKGQNGLNQLAHKKKSTERNYANKAVHHAFSAATQSSKNIEAYFLESFEGTFPPAGWTLQSPDGGTGWGQVANGTTPLDGWNGGTQDVPVGGGNFAAYCTYTTGGTASNDQWLISPQFLATTGDSLKFNVWWFGAYEDSLFILLSTGTNATTDFTTTLLQVDTVNLAPMSTWKHYSINLTPYAGQNVYIAFREKISDNVNMGAYFALDLVSMGTPSPNDVAASSIDVAPIIAPGSVNPTATVSNAGSATQTFNVTMQITGGYTSTKTVTSLAPGASQQVTFDPWTAAQGLDTITVYTQLAGDANTANDTIEKAIAVVLDAQTLSIDVPAIVGPGLQNPKATFKNLGGDVTSLNVTMKITGGYTSTKTIAQLKTDSTIQVTFDPWTAAIGIDTITAYTSLAGDIDVTNDTLSKIVTVQSLTKVYCYVAYDPSSVLPAGPAYTYLQAPDQIVSLADQSALNFVGAGTWGGMNKWYGAVYGDNTLITLDTVTGARTVIGQIGAGISGISFDYKTNKLYGISWDGSASSLYSISTATGAGTLIGLSSSDLLINLACDTLGNLYSVGINTDTLYSINKNTGAATIIGGIGFDAGYAQDMEFDRAKNTLYMAAYNAGTSTGELRTVNTSTGASTLIGSFAGASEISGFAIPYYTSLPAMDAGVSGKSSPIDACGLGNENITVTVENYGTSAINNVPISYKINNGTPVTETITSSIPAGGYLNYTFATQANLTATGVYTIKTYTALAGDAIAANDSLNFVVENVNPSTPTYSMGFETTENLAGWTIEDANADGYTWKIATTGGNNAPYCAQYSYNSASAANDWLITKCISLQASKTYKVSYYYEVKSSTYPEAFTVNIGNAPTSSAQTTSIATYSNLTNTTYTQGSANFTVSADGTYYIGFQCNSAANEYVLYLDDINISDVTGIDVNTDNFSFNVYPNPAKDMINIAATSKINRVKMLNVFGQVVFASDIDNTNTTINTANLADGIYYIQAETENGLITKNVTIRK
jgi:hypothetical protein